MTGRITISVKDLETGYTGKHSVKAVSQGITDNLRSGELTCLLGENGAGKSTLLRTLAGFQPLLKGEIMILDKPLKSYNNKELAQLISVVLTERTTLQNMTVRELVGLGRTPYTGFWGNLSKEDETKVSTALEQVGITALDGRQVQTLSDGERQKVMIAKALAQETPIIFLDEPTAFLDYPSKVDILKLLHRLSRGQDKTIFISTHDLELALQVADRIWLMGKGRSVVTGTSDELTKNGTLESYLCLPGITILE